MKLMTLLLVTLLAAAACSTQGQEALGVKRSFGLPTVVLSPDRPPSESEITGEIGGEVYTSEQL